MRLRILLPFLAAAFCAASALAQDQWAAVYDVRLLGATVGQMSVAGNETAGRYSARSRFATVGVVGALKRVRFDLNAKGRISGHRYAPQSYAENIDDGWRVSQMSVGFPGGVPKLLSGTSGSDAPPADTSGLKGALDPLTALYAALRDQPPGALCRLDADIFDGHRHARFGLTGRRTEGETVTCHGEYRRIAGYSSSDKRKQRYKVAVRYEPHGALMRATEVEVQTMYGNVLLHRR
jgi:hypothetical protein